MLSALILIDSGVFNDMNRSTITSQGIPSSIGAKIRTRKGFILTGLILGVVGLLGWRKKTQLNKPASLKFLSKEGKLVEVDIDKLRSIGRLASNEEVKNWIRP